MVLQFASFPTPHVLDVTDEEVALTTAAAADDDEETAQKEVATKRLRVSTMRAFIIKIYFIYLILYR